MHYSTVYVGMDVHKETFSLCCYTNEKEQAEYPQKVDGHYSKVINYIEAMRFHYRREYATIDEVKKDLFYYIEVFYNRKRLHSSLGYMSPVAYRLKNMGLTNA